MREKQKSNVLHRLNRTVIGIRIARDMEGAGEEWVELLLSSVGQQATGLENECSNEAK